MMSFDSVLGKPLQNQTVARFFNFPTFHKLHHVDAAGRKHLMSLTLPADYPRSAPAIATALPEVLELPWSPATSLRDVYAVFVAAVSRYQVPWDAELERVRLIYMVLICFLTTRGCGTCWLSCTLQCGYWSHHSWTTGVHNLKCWCSSIETLTFPEPIVDLHHAALHYRKMSHYSCSLMCAIRPNCRMFDFWGPNTPRGPWKLCLPSKCDEQLVLLIVSYSAYVSLSGKKKRIALVAAAVCVAKHVHAA